MIENKLGNPDYVGEWEGNVPCEFKMYVLKRYPTVQDTDQIIEGIISDRVGLAVFSGTLSEHPTGKGSIRFQKRYTQLAVREGAFAQLDYDGERLVTERGVVFRGRYQVPGAPDITGAFRLVAISM